MDGDMDARRTLVIATQNQDKVKEIREIWGGLPWDVRSLVDLGIGDAPEEDGETFAENARIKALAAYRATGLPSAGDDSGLCVDALGGAPGVLSSRFAGRAGDTPANNRLLLERLMGVPGAQRSARFVCNLALAWGPEAPASLCDHPGHLVVEGVHTIIVEGRLEGRIADASRGTGGFGYDPLFLLPERDVHLAELPLAEKNAISHRGRAFRELAQVLAGWEEEA